MSIDINLDLNADSLSDVDTTGKDVGDILVWDGTNWIADGTIHVDTVNNKIGIGTSTPARDLHIEGSGNVYGRVQSMDTGLAVWEFINSAGGYNIYTSSDGLFFQSRTSNDEVLEIQSNAKRQSLRIASNQFIVNNQSEDLDFIVRGDTDSNLIRTDATNDRVGIGTSTPSAKLDVIGAFLVSDDAKLNSISIENGFIRVNKDRRNVDFIVSGDNDSTLLLTDAANDRVGIGTSTPSEKLHVVDSSDTTLKIETEDDSAASLIVQNSEGAYRVFTNASSLRIQEAGSSALPFSINSGAASGALGLFGTSVRVNSSSNNVYFRVYGQNDDNLIRTDSANDRVGIGTDAPSEKLDVNGTIKATDINFTGLATFADDSAAGTGGLSSGDVYKTATGELRIKL